MKNGFSPASYFENFSNSKLKLDFKEDIEQKSAEKIELPTNRFNLTSQELVKGVNAFKFSNLGGDNDSKDESDGFDEAEIADNRNLRLSAQIVLNTGQEVETVAQVQQTDRIEKKLELMSINSAHYLQFKRKTYSKN